MSLPIAAIGAVDSTFEIREAAGTSASTQPRAFDALEKMIDEVNDNVVQADHAVRLLSLGETSSLHEVMLSLESARLSMGLMVQVRNRLVDAYQDLMRMQI
jgi:flagellar hook-basal body complex protein FliE